MNIKNIVSESRLLTEMNSVRWANADLTKIMNALGMSKDEVLNTPINISLAFNQDFGQLRKFKTFGIVTCVLDQSNSPRFYITIYNNKDKFVSISYGIDMDGRIKGQTKSSYASLDSLINDYSSNCKQFNAKVSKTVNNLKQLCRDYTQNINRDVSDFISDVTKLHTYLSKEFRGNERFLTTVSYFAQFAEKHNLHWVLK